MAKKDYPPGFPLRPCDAQGQFLREGDSVRVLRIPDELVHGLSDEAQQALKSCEGEVMTIYEVDDYGFMWVEKPVLETEDRYESHSFSMKPEDLLKIEKVR